MQNEKKRPELQKKKRIVIKIGSSSLMHPQTDNLNFAKIEKLVRELCDLRNTGMDVCLVSSGAIAVGRQVIGVPANTDSRSGGHTNSNARKQACAAVGQARLMMTYQKIFSEYHQTVGQILMSKNTMILPESKENARNTFCELFRMGVIPIVNENDTVSTFEMQFGDNDTLSALVTSLVGADLLVLLSDIDGLYTDDPRSNAQARLIPYVRTIDEELLQMGKESTGSFMGTGGMNTKLSAAQIATKAGADMIITNSDDLNVLHHLFDNTYKGTLFTAL
ncbi:MAG: glutamate 5-kinase [Eubacterium sp.]|nr:glutamate 5-kinase [Eubacterium sp.]